MNDITKTFNNFKGGFRITWGNAFSILGIAVLVGGLLIAGGRILESFDNHEREMAEMKIEIKINRQWRIDWPSNPEGLALDGVQNNRLDEHDRRIGVLESK